MPPLSELAKPEAAQILLAPGTTQNGASAMDHQRTYIAVAAFADAEQPSSASARSLLWHKAQPSRKLAAILEAGPVTDSGDQCRRRYWANAFDLAEALARLAIAEDLPYSTIVGCNSPIQVDQFLLQLPHERPDQLAEPPALLAMIWARPRRNWVMSRGITMPCSARRPRT